MRQSTLFDPPPAAPKPVRRHPRSTVRHLVWAATDHQGRLALQRLELTPAPPIVTELVVLRQARGAGLTVWVVGEWFLRTDARAVVDQLQRLHQEGARVRVWEW